MNFQVQGIVYWHEKLISLFKILFLMNDTTASRHKLAATGMNWPLIQMDQTDLHVTVQSCNWCN